MLSSSQIDEFKSDVLSVIDRCESELVLSWKEKREFSPNASDQSRYEWLFESPETENFMSTKDAKKYMKEFYKDKKKCKELKDGSLSYDEWQKWYDADMVINSASWAEIAIPIFILTKCKFNHERFYYKWFDRPRPLKRTRFYWYSFTGKSRIPATRENIEKMKLIGYRIFNNDKWKRFNTVYWNIETGKHEDAPNLHIHALIDFEKSNKNFDRDMTAAWVVHFKSYGLDFAKGGKQMYKGNAVEKIWEDKKNYLLNDEKGILHQNFKDLEFVEIVGVP